MNINNFMYTAVKKFDPSCGKLWTDYIEYTGLYNLKEVVTIDTSLCPRIINVLSQEDWYHNVDSNYRILFFRNYDYLLKRIGDINNYNILALFEEPKMACLLPIPPPGFVFKGFDVVDVCCDVSILTNHGGFSDIFKGNELNSYGLIEKLDRAYEIKNDLLIKHENQPHSHCLVWGIWRLEKKVEYMK